jgi:hypothetical protein
MFSKETYFGLFSTMNLGQTQGSNTQGSNPGPFLKGLRAKRNKKP